MKNIRLVLCILALACMVCLLTPCNILAQEGGDVPCCYNAPPTPSPFNDNIVPLFERAHKSIAINVQFLDNPARTSTTAHMSPMTLASTRKVTGMPVVAESLRIDYGRQS